MKKRAQNTKPTDIARWRTRKEYLNSLQGLGWTVPENQAPPIELTNPIQFYLYDPLISGHSYCATTTLDSALQIKEDVLSQCKMSPKKLGEWSQATAINMLWDNFNHTNRPEDVIYANITNCLGLKTAKWLLDKPLPPGKSYALGMIYYINHRKGVVVNSKARPIGAVVDGPLTPAQLTELTIPFIHFDVKNHPDYLKRFPIMPFLQSNLSLGG